MKTAEWLLNEFKKVKLGESADGTPYYLGTDNKDELQCCIDIAQEYSKENLREELIKFKLKYDKLSPAEKCTVWPPAGSGAGHGLYNLSDEDLIDKYLKQKQ